jgi:hypothetical protein
MDSCNSERDSCEIGSHEEKRLNNKINNSIFLREKHHRKFINQINDQINFDTQKSIE